MGKNSPQINSDILNQLYQNCRSNFESNPILFISEA